MEAAKPGRSRAAVAVVAVAAAATTALLWWKFRSTKSSQQGQGSSAANGAGPSVSRSRAEGQNRPIANGIRKKVTEDLKPEHLKIHDDSASHRGHAGVAGSQIAETHFKVEVVSSAFEGVSKLQRQRRVQDLLKDEFAAGLHALELTCRTPTEHAKVSK